jgi:hypothetical protein
MVFLLCWYELRRSYCFLNFLFRKPYLLALFQWRLNFYLKLGLFASCLCGLLFDHRVGRNILLWDVGKFLSDDTASYFSTIYSLYVIVYTWILAYFSYFEKIKGGLCGHLAVCASVCVSLHNFLGLCDHLAVRVSPLIFVMRFMISPCCLYVRLNFFVFYVVHVVSKESRRLVLPRATSFELRFFYTQKRFKIGCLVFLRPFDLCRGTYYITYTSWSHTRLWDTPPGYLHTLFKTAELQVFIQSLPMKGHAVA